MILLNFKPAPIAATVVLALDSSSNDVCSNTTQTIAPKKNRAHRLSSLTYQRHLLRSFKEGDQEELLSALLLEPTSSYDFIDDTSAPSTYNKMLKRTDAPQWQLAVNSENSSIDAHDVLHKVDSIPQGRKALKVKYIFKRKSDSRFKARLVAMGYNQIYRLDYFETYAPVVSKQTLRTLFALSTTNKWNIHQSDIKTAFLHADLQKDIYHSVPY